MDPTKAKTLLLPRPVKGPITCDFGKRGKLWKQGFHPGVDFGVIKGTPIENCLIGKVHLAGRETHFGWRVWVLSELSCGLVRILYAHCSKILVDRDEIVQPGQVIALSGDSGERRDGKPMPPHLHIQVEFYPSRELFRPEFFDGHSRRVA